MHAKNFARSFRLVCSPDKIDSVNEFLAAEGFISSPEPFSIFARKIIYEPFPLGSSLAALFGYIYIQDRSSMLPPLALNPSSTDFVLDMCASPGSKTGLLAQLIGNSGLVLANEPAQGRLATLRANLDRASALNIITSNYSGEKIPLAKGIFDKILLDPPCSGWGTVNKNPSVIKIWKDAKIRPLITLQRKLLKKAADLLLPGGFLSYSTCTTNYAENEEQICFAENELDLKRVSIKPFPGFIFEERKNGQKTLLVDGGKSQSQGFYIALLQKGGIQKASNVSLWDHISNNFNEDNWFDTFVDSSLLPPGKLEQIKNQVYFLHNKTAQLPANISWKGPSVGQIHTNGEFRLNNKLRTILGIPNENTSIIFNDAKQIRRLLEGQNIKTGIKSRYASIWWHDLPLGICQIKNGRIIANFR